MKQVKGLIRVIGLINKYVGVYGGGAALLVLLFITAFNVLFRYVFRMPFEFALELDEDLMVVLAFLVGGYTMFLDAHVRVDILFHKLSPKKRAIQEVVTYPLVLIFFFILIWKGIAMTYEALEFHATSPGMEWPYWIVYIFVPFGGILIALQAIATFLGAVVRLVENNFQEGN